MTTDKYCDCAQGRWPCTCMPRYSIEQQALSNDIDDAAKARGLRAYARYWAEKFRDDYPTATLVDKNNSNALSQLAQASSGGALRAEEFNFMLNGPTIAPDPYMVAAEAIKSQPGFWQRLATDKAKLFALKCAEFDALNARLQVYRGVALIGWAGFILVLLGV
jgi:hypothetical protein